MEGNEGRISVAEAEGIPVQLESPHWIVEEWNGMEYARGAFPADALTAAVLKFSPDQRKKVRQAIWEYMRQRGFRLSEAKRYSTEGET